MHGFLCAVLGALAGAALRYPQAAADAAWYALCLWARHILPALFPMLTCMLICTSCLPQSPLLSLVLGWLCGSPGGARLCHALDLDQRTRHRLAALSGTMSPMFLLSAVPGYLRQSALGPALLFCHLAGAFFTGMILYPGALPLSAEKKPPTPLALPDAILQSARAMITVCGCICLGAVACRMVLCIFPRLPGGIVLFLQCLLEVTGGLNALGNAALPSNIKALLSVMAASFGGLSILMQNAAFWSKSGVGFFSLFCYRLCHALISGLIYTALFF